MHSRLTYQHTSKDEEKKKRLEKGRKTMNPIAATVKPHAVLVPFPAQGHINPMMKLAKLLHCNGFHITFVNTEYNHRRLLKSGSSATLQGVHGFHFEAIPDGLSPSCEDATQDIPSLCDSTSITCLAPLLDLISRLNDPPVSCIIGDGVMSFTLDAAEKLGIPVILFWTTSACGFMAYLHFQLLAERGLVPLKDCSDLSNGYLETPVDSVAGMKNMRLKDFPSFARTTDSKDFMFNFANHEAQRAFRASAIILNTFEELEGTVLDAMRLMLPPIYAVGPLSLLSTHMPKSPLPSMNSNLWKEDPKCMQWLKGRKPKSVLYVNFGSITVMTDKQMIEFAWALANSKHDFIWIIRPDLIKGNSSSAVLSLEFLEETKDRGLLASWCPQEELLSNEAIGGFLTHSGWNSMIESLSAGVPMLCWPFFAEQQTNCRYACTDWGVGMEIDTDVRREEVEGLIRELMDGNKGREMRKRAKEWKDIAARAIEIGGPSRVNFERLVSKMCSQGKKGI